MSNVNVIHDKVSLLDVDNEKITHIILSTIISNDARSETKHKTETLDIAIYM